MQAVNGWKEVRLRQRSAESEDRVPRWRLGEWRVIVACREDVERRHPGTQDHRVRPFLAHRAPGVGLCDGDGREEGEGLGAPLQAVRQLAHEDEGAGLQL